MAITCRRLGAYAVLVATLVVPVSSASAISYEERPAGMRALYTGIAVVANVMPGVSALYAPKCLPGYVVCKVVFAGISIIAAGDQFVMSGGGDRAQTRAILYRGFAGDWYLTGRHVSGDLTPEPLPEPPPASSEGGGGKWEPPPL
jgi:hypothetical protein